MPFVDCFITEQKYKPHSQTAMISDEVIVQVKPYLVFFRQKPCEVDIQIQVKNQSKDSLYVDLNEVNLIFGETMPLSKKWQVSSITIPPKESLKKVITFINLADDQLPLGKHMIHIEISENFLPTIDKNKNATFLHFHLK
jgi:hypothetical protein